jgi:hypothetical protein
MGWGGGDDLIVSISIILSFCYPMNRQRARVHVIPGASWLLADTARTSRRLWLFFLPRVSFKKVAEKSMPLD